MTGSSITVGYKVTKLVIFTLSHWRAFNMLYMSDAFKVTQVPRNTNFSIEFYLLRGAFLETEWKCRSMSSNRLQTSKNQCKSGIDLSAREIPSLNSSWELRVPAPVSASRRSRSWVCWGCHPPRQTPGRRWPWRRRPPSPAPRSPGNGGPVKRHGRGGNKGKNGKFLSSLWQVFNDKQ